MGDDQQERGFTLIIAFLSQQSEIAFAFFLLSPPRLKVHRVATDAPRAQTNKHVCAQTCTHKGTADKSLGASDGGVLGQR